MMKRLAIIGASYLQLPLIKRAKDMGFETHVFSWEEGAVGKDYSDHFYPISITEKLLIYKKCKAIKPDGIATIASDLAVRTVNYVAEKLGLVGNSAFSSDVMTNKYLMREQLFRKKLPCPQFLLVKDSLNLESKISSFKYPLIVKPTDRSGSRGITKIDSLGDLKHSVDRAIEYSLSNSAIIEEFVTGTEISVETISFKGKHYHLAITDKVTTGAPYFVELEHHQPSIFVQSCENQIKQVVEQSLDALEFTNGASHCELLVSSGNEITIVEIGGRMGGDFIGSDLVMLSTGYDFVKGVIEVALGQFSVPEVNGYKKYSGVKYFRNDSGVVKSISLNKNFDSNIMYRQEILLDAGDKIAPIRESADRIGYFIYQSNQRQSDGDFPFVIEVT